MPKDIKRNRPSMAQCLSYITSAAKEVEDWQNSQTTRSYAIPDNADKILMPPPPPPAPLTIVQEVELSYEEQLEYWHNRDNETQIEDLSYKNQNKRPDTPINAQPDLTLRDLLKTKTKMRQQYKQNCEQNQNKRPDTPIYQLDLTQNSQTHVKKKTNHQYQNIQPKPTPIKYLPTYEEAISNRNNCQSPTELKSGSEQPYQNSYNTLTFDSSYYELCYNTETADNSDTPNATVVSLDIPPATSSTFIPYINSTTMPNHFSPQLLTAEFNNNNKISSNESEASNSPLPIELNSTTISPSINSTIFFPSLESVIQEYQNVEIPQIQKINDETIQPAIIPTYEKTTIPQSPQLYFCNNMCGRCCRVTKAILNSPLLEKMTQNIPSTPNLENQFIYPEVTSQPSPIEIIENINTPLKEPFVETPIVRIRTVIAIPDNKTEPTILAPPLYQLLEDNKSILERHGSQLRKLLRPYMNIPSPEDLNKTTEILENDEEFERFFNSL